MAPPVSDTKPTDPENSVYKMLEVYSGDNRISSEEVDQIRDEVLKEFKVWGAVDERAKKGIYRFFNEKCHSSLVLDQGVPMKLVKDLGLDPVEMKRAASRCSGDIEVADVTSPTSVEIPAAGGLEDWGLQASPAVFAEKLYAFNVKDDPSNPPFISPLHEVTLAGHPEIVVPWSDPYLLLEWQAFLGEAGVEIQTAEGDLASAVYLFKGQRIMESRRVETGIKFQLFSPSGKVESELLIPSPKKPKIEVSFSGDPNDEWYTITVYGRSLDVGTIFPDDFTQEEKTKSMQTLGEVLQEIPESIIAPFLEGVEREKPVKIIIAEGEEARKLGWINRFDDIPGGNYHDSENTIWGPPWCRLTMDDKRKDYLRGLYFHEFGHAHDDFDVPDDDSDNIADHDRSALRDYYVWSLSQVFTPSELKHYIRLANQFDSWEGDRKSEEFQELIRSIVPLRKRALKRFVSIYALEGQGIDKEVKRPGEYFAEVSEIFFRCLSGNKDWKEYRSREPLLVLFGLDYLFHSYDIAHIGNLKRGEVFSKKAFHEVLGINLDYIDEEAFRSIGLPLDNRSGWMVAFVGGASTLLRSESRTINTGVALGIRLGYRDGDVGWGGSFDYLSHEIIDPVVESSGTVDIMDGGIWGQMSTEMGPFTLFVEPALGLRRWSKPSDIDYSFWLGSSLGLGLLGNSVALTAQTKFDPFDAAEWQNLEYGLRFDLPAFVRYIDYFVYKN